MAGKTQNQVTPLTRKGDANRFISFIVESAERMERLIHDLLNFSRVEARGADFFAKIDYDTVLDDAIRNLRSSNRGERRDHYAGAPAGGHRRFQCRPPRVRS